MSLFFIFDLISSALGTMTAKLWVSWEVCEMSPYLLAGLSIIAFPIFNVHALSGWAVIFIPSSLVPSTEHCMLSHTEKILAHYGKQEVAGILKPLPYPGGPPKINVKKLLLKDCLSLIHIIQTEHHFRTPNPRFRVIPNIILSHPFASIQWFPKCLWHISHLHFSLLINSIFTLRLSPNQPS